MILKDKNRNYTFMMEMDVRDYELDCEQIVNNANYLHYMEHTRHKFCHEVGFPFIEMHRQGIDVVVRKIEVEYITSLHADDRFISALNMERRGARFIFRQDIFLPDGQIVARGIVTVAVVKDGKVSRGEELAEYFAPYMR